MVGMASLCTTNNNLDPNMYSLQKYTVSSQLWCGKWKINSSLSCKLVSMQWIKQMNAWIITRKPTDSIKQNINFYLNLPSRRIWEGSPCDKFSLRLAMLWLSAVTFGFISLNNDACGSQQKKNISKKYLSFLYLQFFMTWWCKSFRGVYCMLLGESLVYRIWDKVNTFIRSVWGCSAFSSR